MSIVGIDIGGANLKFASVDGRIHSQAFPMWTRWKGLSSSLREGLATFGSVTDVAITMTGELADCFLDRGEGVRHIAESVQQACGESRAAFYNIRGQFVSCDVAVRQIDEIAASNWHALASLVAEEVTSTGILIDIGSTTTDIISVREGKVATQATTDFDRLSEGSLVYVGCTRTPVCSLVDRLTYRGSTSRVMNEWFATMDDVRLVLGSQAEQADDCDSADGKPRTVFHAINRLARMIGLDHRNVSIADAKSMAVEILHSARQMILGGVEQISQSGLAADGAPLIVSGHGPDLLHDSLIGRPNSISLGRQWGEAIARCGPAFAVAKLLAGNRASNQIC